VHFPYLLVSRFSLAYCRAVCFFALGKILVEYILGGLFCLLVISGVRNISRITVLALKIRTRHADFAEGMVNFLARFFSYLDGFSV
jgi:hypothetical protein